MSGETITRLRGTPVPGRISGVTIDWSNPDELTIEGWLVTPKGSTEDNADRSAVTDGLELTNPSIGIDILPTDRLVIRGATYDVDGDPDVWTDPDDRTLDATVVTATRAAG